MKVHSVKAATYLGDDYAELYTQARRLFDAIRKRTKRQPYIKASYFKKDKVFLELFWVHLGQKNYKDRKKRLKFYKAGLELLRDTTQTPAIKTNPNKRREILYRFAGVTSDHNLFYVQVKEDTQSGRKDFMSVFPEK